MPESRHGSFLFAKVVRSSITPIARLLFRMRCQGREHVPEQGPFIMVANHSSYLDPLVLAAACPRYLRFFALDSVFKLPGIKPVLIAAGALPVFSGARTTGVSGSSTRVSGFVESVTPRS